MTVKLKTNHSYFTYCILQMVVTNRKLCYSVVWTPYDEVINTISFDDITWKDIKKEIDCFL